MGWMTITKSPFWCYSVLHTLFLCTLSPCSVSVLALETGVKWIRAAAAWESGGAGCCAVQGWAAWC